jgi:anti-sigma factor RsiW
MTEHQTELLGAYVLGVLDGDEWATVRTHLRDCQPCRREVDDLRELEDALGEIPPEAFLDGPATGGEQLLERTLDQVRKEGSRRAWRRRSLWALAAALIGVVALGAGTILGRDTAPAAPATAAGSGGQLTAAGQLTGTATDASTGVTMTVALQPAAGWVRVHATVSGAPAGEECRLYVVARDGSRREAGSWLVPANAPNGTSLDGAALVAPADVTAVQAETFAAQPLVTVPV